MISKTAFVILAFAIAVDAQLRPVYRNQNIRGLPPQPQPKNEEQFYVSDAGSAVAGMGNQLKQIILERCAKSQIDSKIQAYKAAKADSYLHNNANNVFKNDGPAVIRFGAKLYRTGPIW